MKYRNFKLACMLPSVVALLGGCISNIPVDLAVTSVQAVDWRNQDEIPGPGASALLGLVPTRDLALSGESIAGGPKPPRLLLKVEFTSAMNLAKYAIENSYNLGNTAYFCDWPRPNHAFVGLSFSPIYWRGQRLGQHESDPIERNVKSAGMPVTYYIFIDAVQEKPLPSKPPVEAYDLRQQPRDICFTVGGGGNSGFGYQSNTVVIPKDAITAALEKRPQGF